MSQLYLFVSASEYIRTSCEHQIMFRVTLGFSPWSKLRGKKEIEETRDEYKELICKGQDKKGSEQHCMVLKIPCFLLLHALESHRNTQLLWD